MITQIRIRTLRDATGQQLRFTRQMLTQLLAESTAAVEAKAKQNLQRMVYDTPEPASYVRTGNLMQTTQSTFANDEGEVFSGADYAVHVHEGTASVQPRPYLEDALEDEYREVPKRARRIARSGP